jgi:hypothetical protein
MVGGSRPKKTLLTVALRGDAWNTSAWLEEVRGKVETLERHCDEVGAFRFVGERLRFPGFPVAALCAARDAWVGIDIAASAPTVDHGTGRLIWRGSLSVAMRKSPLVASRKSPPLD